MSSFQNSNMFSQFDSVDPESDHHWNEKVKTLFQYYWLNQLPYKPVEYYLDFHISCHYQIDSDNEENLSKTSKYDFQVKKAGRQNIFKIYFK